MLGNSGGRAAGGPENGPNNGYDAATAEGTPGGVSLDQLRALARAEQKRLQENAAHTLFGDRAAPASETAPGPRGRGRPKGARNRRTLAMLEIEARKGEMPLQTMLRIMRDQRQPAAVQLQAAIAAAPYVHERIPQAKEITLKAGLILQLEALPQNQGLSDAAAGAVGRALLDVTKQAVEIAEENEPASLRAHYAGPGADPGADPDGAAPEGRP